MTLQDLGSLGELISGIAVLITLIYLSIQMKQVKNSTQRSSIIESNQVFNDIFLASMTSPDFAKVLDKASADYQALESHEKIMLTQYLAAYINAVEISIDLITHGEFDQELASDVDALLSGFFDYPGALEHWTQYEMNYTASFRVEVKRFMDKKHIT